MYKHHEQMLTLHQGEGEQIHSQDHQNYKWSYKERDCKLVILSEIELFITT